MCLIVDFGITYTLAPDQSPVRSRAILRRTRPNAKCIIARLFKICANNYGNYYNRIHLMRDPAHR